MPDAQEPQLTAKAVETRDRIVSAALDLMEEVGYDKATMRAIAKRAEVAPSNAYYYFPSKEALIQGFYGRTHAEHLVLVEPALKGVRALKQRLLVVMRTKYDSLERYHAVSGALFKAAADPKSPLNPFSDESAAVREEAIAVFAEAIEGSSTKIHTELAEELPELLWTWHMSMILYWIHDDSEEHRRTWHLTERTVDLITKLVKLGGLPLMGPVRRAALKLVRELRTGDF